MNSTYPSRYTNRKVTAAQYLAELMAERQYKKDHPGLDPKFQFWKDKEWAKEFVKQCVQFSRLEKLGITAPAISAVLKGPKGKMIYSMGHPLLKKLALVEQGKLDQIAKNLANSPLPAPVDESLPLNRESKVPAKKSKLELLDEENDG